MKPLIDPPDYIANVPLIDELNRIYELLGAHKEGDAEDALGTLLDILDPTDTEIVSEAACPTCGSTDGFHTEEACLEA